MNKRIKDLILKATENNPSLDEFGIIMGEEDIEKFSDLLIKECITIAEKQRNPHTLNYKPSERFVEELRQHFGVK